MHILLMLLWIPLSSSTCPPVSISAQDYQLNSLFSSMLQIYLSSQSNALAVATLTQNSTAVTAETQKMSFFPMILYASPFYIGLIAILVIWLFMCCCCMCPNTCPPKRCRKNNELWYTKTELIIPSIMAMFILGITVAAGIYGYLYVRMLPTNVQSAGCGLNIALNNIISGNNVSNFMGLNNTYNNLTSVYNLINSNISSYSASDINFVNTYSAPLLMNLSLLGDGSTPNNSFSLTYINTTPMSMYPLNSSLSNLLGNPALNNSMINILYSNITTAVYSLSILEQSILNTTKTIGQLLQSLITQVSTYNTRSTAAQIQLSSLSTTANNAIPYIEYSLISFLALFGLVTLITIISLVINMKSSNYVRLLYGSCMCLWVVALIGFAISCFLIVFVPLYYLECKNISNSFSSSGAFDNAATTLGMGVNQASSLSSCINGDGNYLLTTNLTTVQNQIASSITQFAQLQNSLSPSTLSNLFTNTSTTINDYLNGYLNDIIYDVGAYTWFRNVSNSTQYKSSCTGDVNYKQDTLLPSTNPLSLTIFPCNSPYGIAKFCNNISNCSSGCIDLNYIFSNEPNASALAADFAYRYNMNPTCGPLIASEMSVVYNNWYLPRINNMTGIQSLYNRYLNSINPTPLISSLTNISDTTSVISSNLNLIQNTTNNNIFPSQNCTSLKPSILSAKDSICVVLFNNIYMLTMLIGTVSFGSFISMCFVACSGYRHYRQHNKIKYEQNTLEMLKVKTTVNETEDECGQNQV